MKPDNIVLTRDGRIKILDFGLARTSASRTAAAADETLTIHTEPGVVLGTVGYMSPEQVRGKEADQRSDIFSFGVVLYELLSGGRAFHGETAAETMTAILKQELPELPEAVPAGVREVVHHGLDKDPANRFQSARDLSFALSAMSHGGRSNRKLAPVMPRRSSWRRRMALVLAGAMLVAMGTLAGRMLWHTPEPTSWTGEILGGGNGPRLAPFSGRTPPRLPGDGQGSHPNSAYEARIGQLVDSYAQPRARLHQ